MASALTALLLWLLHLSPLALTALLIAVTVLGTWAAGEAERALGHGKDPGAIVIDEVAGMVLAVLAVPPTLLIVAVAFFLFRVFDVIKPYPANRLEKFHGGFGIMADDAMAGIYANLALRLLIWLLPAWIH